MRFFTLKLLIFFEYAVQGAYLTTLGVYLINSLKFAPMEVAAVYSLLGLASLFILPLTGIIADKFLSATRLYIILFLLCSLCLFSLGMTADKTVFFVLFALNSLVYIPTLALSNTILLYSLEQANADKDTNFVAIKVWGTIGFIAAIWLVSFSGLSAANAQFYIAAGAAFCACVTGFLQQKVPVWGDKGQNGGSLKTCFRKMIKSGELLWIYALAICVGILVQADNIYANKFLSDINLPYYAVWSSFSQVSGLVIGIFLIFIIAHIKLDYIIFISIIAWIIKLAGFAYTDLSLSGYANLILSILAYGIAYKFFTNGAALYVDAHAPHEMRSTAQALLLMLYNGIGAICGGFITSWLVMHYTIDKFIRWPAIWALYCLYAVCLLFLACLSLFFIKRSA